MHLRESCRRTFQVGCGRIDARSWHQVRVDPALHFQVGVRFQAAGGTHGSNASRQIESWRGVWDLRNEQPRLSKLSVLNLDCVRIGVVEMVVHSNQARDNRVAGALDLLRPLRNLGGRGGTDGQYFAIRDHDRLVFFRRCTSSINDSDVVKNEDGRVDTYKVRDITRLLGLGSGGSSDKQRAKQNQKTHSMHLARSTYENRQEAGIVPQR